MQNSPQKKSQTRMIVATSLFAISIFASFLISYTSNIGEKYWVLTRPLAKGVQINSSDLALVKAKLDSTITVYASEASTVIGAITQRNLEAGHLIAHNDISEDAGVMDREELSLSVRAADIPTSTRVGDLVSIFQIHDTRNGEAAVDPVRVISGVFLSEISRKSANFGSDLSITVTLSREDVPLLLAATSSGRLVVVTSHG